MLPLLDVLKIISWFRIISKARLIRWVFWRTFVCNVIDFFTILFKCCSWVQALGYSRRRTTNRVEWKKRQDATFHLNPLVTCQSCLLWTLVATLKATQPMSQLLALEEHPPRNGGNEPTTTKTPKNVKFGAKGVGTSKRDKQTARTSSTKRKSGKTFSFFHSRWSSPSSG